MSQELPSARSHLFTVRLWEEDLGDGQSEWRGKVQHVANGEVHYFRAWEGLVELVRRLLLEQDHKSASSE